MSGHDDSEREEIRAWQKRLAAEQLDAAARREEDEQREREYLRLVAEHGSPEAAVIANPDRREEIEEVYERLELERAERALAERESVIIPARDRHSLGRAIDRLLDAERQAERDAQEARIREQEARIRDLQEPALAASIGAPPAAAAPASAPRPPLPNGVNSYTYGTIQKAVEAFAVGSTRNEVATATGIQRKDATRMRNLWAGGLLSLNDRGKILVDPRVGRAGGRIALRYLDDRCERWLDPSADPPSPVRGGSG